MIRILLRVVIVLVVAVAAFVAYLYFSGGSGEPSQEVTAPELEAVSDQVVYVIDKTQSTVRFEMDEILRGSPTRVIGRTSEIAGEVKVDFDNPAASEVGTVVINVRTLATDSSLRDRAMRGQILNSNEDENEFAQFVPTSVAGLPDQIVEGQPIPLAITGDFTLSGMTRAVAFEATAVLVTQNRLEVGGTATVLRSEFGLEIPDLPFLAEVSNEILLGVELVALSI